MEHPFWFKQTADTPLFPELEWSRPENKLQAGKLLIIGGNAHSFAAPAEAYIAANKAGIGVARVILPQRLKRMVGNVLETVEYAMSNPSGGFSQMALDDMLAHADWADGVLLAGDFGRNSETAILLEKFLAKYDGQVTITKDAVDYFTSTPRAVLDRPATTLVLSFAQLQKLGISAKFTSAFTFDMDFLRLIDALHDFTSQHPIAIITKHLGTLFVAVGGKVSTTRLHQPVLHDSNDGGDFGEQGSSHSGAKVWRVQTAATASTWWLQNTSKTFEALTTAVQSTQK